MDLDGQELAKTLQLSGTLPVHTQLCRKQLDRFEAALDDERSVMVACTQEAPLFGELANDKNRHDISFVNIRERAGWCEARKDVLPKVAALIAEAQIKARPTGQTTITSQGQCLVYGAGQQALDVAEQLASRLSVTVILTDANDAIPPSTVAVPLHAGRIRRATGSLGRFEVAVDQFAPALPSSKETLAFEAPRDGFSTKCDIILDLSGDNPLFSDSVTRDGYVRADPGQAVAVAKAMFDVSDLVGEFEKPLYVAYDGDICAHGRSGKIGCRNCLDHCPTGALSPTGDTIAVATEVCGGCGNCSAVCPTGAISYAYPDREDLNRRIQTLSQTYRFAGGRDPVLLVHDESHGGGVIAILARYGRGLPANAIPLTLYSVFQIGHETLSAAIASGFSRIVVLAPPDKPHDLPALESQAALTNMILDSLGYGADRITVLVERDPDTVAEALYGLAPVAATPATTISLHGGKRDVARLAIGALHAAAPDPKDVIALPDGAPYGRLIVDAENCTLCLACVGACPAGALRDDEERPRLSFNEAACVQCGLCTATCPERVIALEPRYNFTSAVLEPQTIKEEEPFECITCGKPFGTKSTVERIISKLEGRHAMFQNSDQINIIKMCDDCRVVAVTDAGGDPMTLGERPRVRTTDDYLAGHIADDEDS
ncbi:MAG: 4Fe-4S binding protein [Hyphomicrobiaceae bacterium]